MSIDQGWIDDLKNELAAARRGFPSNEDCIFALIEEVGELSQALIQMKHEPHKGKSQEDIYQEAIQVACMGIRVATEGVPGFPYHAESGYRGKSWPGYQHPPSSVIATGDFEIMLRRLARVGRDADDLHIREISKTALDLIKRKGNQGVCR